jgi:hypothetical protein
VFTQWAEFNGGKIISSGSDEAVLEVSVTAIAELEELKDKYQQKTGFSVSIGIGEKISDAAKALIYAKMNGKNQIVDYSPEMEETMKQSISGELSEESEEEQVPEHEQHLDEEGKEIHDATEMESDEEEILEEENAQVAEADQADADFVEEEAEGELPIEGEGELPPEEGISEGEEEFIGDEEGETESAIEEEALDEMSEGQVGDEDIDLDGQPDLAEDHGEITPEDDLDQDGDVEHEEAIAAEGEEEYSDEGDYMDEEINPDEFAVDEEGGEELAMDEEQLAEEEELADSIASEMGEDIAEEEMPMEGEEEMMPEAEGEDALRDVIYESLQSFRENRDYLESISQENPDLYNALVYTLQAMIEMAKELGYGVEEEMMGEDDGMLGEEDEAFGGEEVPVEGEEELEEDMNPDDFAVDEGEEVEEETEEDEDFEKNESFVKLMFKMGRIAEKFNSLKKEEMSLDELKEESKKKAEAKAKVTKPSGKKKKAKGKKSASASSKKKQKSSGGSNDGSFCAKSHNKMRASGKDCRANEDKDSPLCSARKKFNCRGKNEEKKSIQKTEKLSKFLKKKDEDLEKSKLATKQTTKHTVKPHAAEGAQKGYKVKDIDNETGKANWIDGSRGLTRDNAGDPVAPEGNSPLSIPKQKKQKLEKI